MTMTIIGIAFVQLSLLFTSYGACETSVQAPYDGHSTGIVGNATVSGNGTGLDENGKLMIESEGVRLYFIPYGARITNLFVNDSSGKERDIVLGFDNSAQYERSAEKFGGILGPYANKIQNSTFNLTMTNVGSQYHLLSSSDNSTSTMDSGPSGWDNRNWTIISHTSNSITFASFDWPGKAGFPGQVIAHVTYTATPNKWWVRISGLSTTDYSPIMASNRVYWNLDGFQDPKTDRVLSNHSLELPYSGQRVQTDLDGVPTGEIFENRLYSVWDFWSAKKALGANFTSKYIRDNCGQNCTGYDNCFLLNGREAIGQYAWTENPVARLQSKFSGIRLSLYTNQEGLHISTCNGLPNGTIPLKTTQQNKFNRSAFANQYACLGTAPEDWIAGINHPGWMRNAKQAYGPQDAAYIYQAMYSFTRTTSTTQCSTRPTTDLNTPKSTASSTSISVKTLKSSIKSKSPNDSRSSSSAIQTTESVSTTVIISPPVTVRVSETIVATATITVVETQRSTVTIMRTTTQSGIL